MTTTQEIELATDFVRYVCSSHLIYATQSGPLSFTIETRPPRTNVRLQIDAEAFTNMYEELKSEAKYQNYSPGDTGIWELLVDRLRGNLSDMDSDATEMWFGPPPGYDIQSNGTSEREY
jgi:hypothetical protein